MMEYFFGQNLRYLREKQGIEQQDIADKVGLKSTSGASEWEKGLRLPKMGVIAQVAEMFSVTIDDLMYIDRIAVGF